MKKTVSVKSTMAHGFRIDAQIREHAVVIDQMPPGGNNEGPTPLELFFFSLAGCIASISRMVAMQKKIDLKGVEIEVSGDVDIDVLLGKHKNARAGFESIEVKVDIDSDMTQEEKEAFLHEVDSRCPVSDNISSPTPVKIVCA